MEHEVVGVGHVGHNERDAALHQAGDEVNAPALAVGRDAIIGDIGGILHALEYRVYTYKGSFICVQ